MDITSNMMSWYGFLLASSTTELLISGSFFCNSWRDRCSTIPAPMESPRTLVTVRNRSLRTDREQGSDEGLQNPTNENEGVLLGDDEVERWQDN
ncbi:hypothetical protein EYF80_009145 [Liparis tanakae]|uniref:Uncharacterized protein n=1 Tax=Liparis tanakae TaxID=230148 RepID=A0A4Z2ISA3_9TELE|nr:hypothetical protein EYF80_009145 [Liparis tanakae]